MVLVEGSSTVETLTDAGISPEVIEDLKSRQHTVTTATSANSWPVLIVIDPATKTASAAGSAAGKVD